MHYTKNQPLIYPLEKRPFFNIVAGYFPSSLWRVVGIDTQTSYPILHAVEVERTLHLGVFRQLCKATP